MVILQGANLASAFAIPQPGPRFAQDSVPGPDAAIPMLTHIVNTASTDRACIIELASRVFLGGLFTPG
jgi:hypothetical protein